MPQHSEEIIRQTAEQAFSERSIEYDRSVGLKIKFGGLMKLPNSDIEKATWIVSYLTPVNPVFDQDLHFAHIDDSTNQFLYIITPTTYIM
ncbi:hypothetical protein J2I47_20315 [Fibrella sp. HMF5335]|uniref:Uncharacterized protein n=1 Tax=Fibrella rubiginis TaxID=2817060 RepID=A0A939GKG2_9BACT|nr:hypothetical protein [Fibrella rubiginis]MBO0938909.1 hypothetical protein [Fibrella rubiginis]